MKKLAMCLAVLLSGAAVTAQAGYPTGTSPCAVTVPSYGGGFTFGLTGLYWQATSPQRDFAVSFLGDDFFSIETFRNISDLSLSDFDFTDRHFHSINHDFEWGFKANIGYIFPCSGNDVNLTYTHFNDNRDRTINDFVLPSILPLATLFADPFTGPVITGEFFSAPDVGFISFVTPIADLLNSESASEFELTDFSHKFYAKSDLENHTWDLDFGQAINVGCNFNFRLFGGLRYSKLEYKLQTINNLKLGFESGNSLSFESNPVEFGILSSDFENIAAGDTVEGVVNIGFADSGTASLDLDFTESNFRKSRFEGLGPRIGVDMKYHLCNDFGLIANLSTSLLVGRINNNLDQSVTLASILTLPEISNLSIGLGNPDINMDDLPTTEPGSTTLDFSQSRPRETRVVPNIDAKLGVDYSYQFCNCSRTRLTVEAGYQVSHYFSAVDRLGLIDGSNFGLDSGCHNTVDLSFDGPYVSVQVAL